MSTLYPQPLLDLHEEITVDLFAGGGGASSGFEQATGRPVTVAINHDAAAIAMHRANHPQTYHFQTNIWEVDPRMVVRMFGDRPVGFMWASPDCTDHSKAKGGIPKREKDKKSRSLGWVIQMWAGTVRPKIIHCENVEEWKFWGPLTGPSHALRACKKRRGRYFKQLVRNLRAFGYAVEHRELRACAYGAATIRKRLYLIARCDGQPIVWPDETHADPKGKKFDAKVHKPYDQTANHIDWLKPMCSIFATREEAKAWAKEHGQACPQRPLKFNTNKRIARGVKRFVLDNPNPYMRWIDYAARASGVFTVGVGGRAGQSQERSVEDPGATITAKGDTAVVAPMLAQVAHGEESASGKRRGGGVQSVEEPNPTMTAKGTNAIIAPVIGRTGQAGGNGDYVNEATDPLTTVTSKAEHYAISAFTTPRYGERDGQEPRGRAIDEPAATIVPSANGDQIVAPMMVQSNHGDVPFSSVEAPLRTIMAGGQHHAITTAHLATYYGWDSHGDKECGC